MVLVSSLYLFRDARSWLDKVHVAWLALGLALAWPLAWPWLALGLALGFPISGKFLGGPGRNKNPSTRGLHVSPGEIYWNPSETSDPLNLWESSKGGGA